MPQVNSTPLAGPVLPVVKAIMASSSAFVPAIAQGVSPSSLTCRSDRPPQKRRGPAVTAIFTLLKKRGAMVRSTCATGMPMKASAPVLARQCSMRRTPMPGSTRTGTAPALRSPSMRPKNSTPGFTMTMVFTPRPMPARARPRA